MADDFFPAAFPIIPLATEKLEPVAELVTRVFIEHEPTTACIHLTREVFHPYSRAYCEISCASGLGVMAIDPAVDRPVGAAICLDVMDDVRELFPDLKHERFAPKIPDLALVSALEEPFTRRHQIVKGQCAQISQVVVDRAFHGRGLATAMIQESISRARKSGFLMIIAVCTGPASLRAHEKCGFRPEGGLSFASYVDAAGKKPYASLSGDCILMVHRFHPAPFFPGDENGKR